METRGLSEREAYRFLQKTSQDKNTPMVDLAKKILLAAPLLQRCSSMTSEAGARTAVKAESDPSAISAEGAASPAARPCPRPRRR